MVTSKAFFKSLTPEQLKLQIKHYRDIIAQETKEQKFPQMLVPWQIGLAVCEAELLLREKLTLFN